MKINFKKKKKKQQQINPSYLRRPHPEKENLKLVPYG